MRAEAAFLARGLLAHVPWYGNRLRRRARTGGTDSARYCYSVWLRHLAKLFEHGFRGPLRSVAELGPGDSIGVGLAALLSGAETYVALDIVPYSSRAAWPAILDELVALFERRSPIPASAEFPDVRPPLEKYDFPEWCLVGVDLSPARIRSIREEISRPDSRRVRYVCPWPAAGVAERGSVDLIYSQAVMEHVLDLEGAYRASFDWLKPGGWCSHVIDFRCHGASSAWNGHWRFPEPLWRLAVARREFTMNRRPFSDHLECVRRAGFEVAHQKADIRQDGLDRRRLARPFRDLSVQDVRTSGAHLILRKPGAGRP